ncbi:hypothetical protein TRFO_39812 [Tritrichomonas foetus]|uniref:Uncharacterized protein n=1 Tax=Tritrichomonas foetus TaxID=1144522 RepID=A0A1J4J8K6_9EUKA|nr:hypothetical protein TRFO_39812 [Tritrichomonas foetus]|eukprot:OHS94019.1 hypothetical protein TRFO_39812 [Tritrichomonas foetus]
MPKSEKEKKQKELTKLFDDYLATFPKQQVQQQETAHLEREQAKLRPRAAKKLRYMINQYATKIHPEYQNFQKAISGQIREENQVYQ